MSAFIPCSNIPLQSETVPAIKILHFNGHPRADEVYAYARIYACDGLLHYCFMRFEEEPADTVRFGFALANADKTGEFVFLNIGFKGCASLGYYKNNKLCEELSLQKPRLFTSGDEQGLYNGAEGVISLDALKAYLKREFAPGEVFVGNFFSYDTSEAAFGCAFAVPLGESIPTTAGFEPLLCISFD
ncbi:MAG: hypothetical protein RSE10_06420 [Oscillospiraceae bacterium]